MSSVNTAPCPPRSSGSLSCNVTTVTAVISAMTFSASGAAPTPLYQEYQSHFGLTPFMVTVIFAAYVLCLLLALLTVGSLSDYIGRRPAILSALAMNVVAMLIFMTAGSAGALVVARAVQGFATGFATTALGATLRRLREASQINCSHRELDRYLWITGVYISWLDQKDANAELRGVLDNPSRSQIRLLNAFLPSTLERRFLTNDSTSFCSD